MSADKDASPEAMEVTPAMLKAGAEIAYGWDHRVEDGEEIARQIAIFAEKVDNGARSPLKSLSVSVAESHRSFDSITV